MWEQRKVRPRPLEVFWELEVGGAFFPSQFWVLSVLSTRLLTALPMKSSVPGGQPGGSREGSAVCAPLQSAAGVVVHACAHSWAQTSTTSWTFCNKLQNLRKRWPQRCAIAVASHFRSSQGILWVFCERAGR